MTKIVQEFYSKDRVHSKYRLGHVVASSLSGFLAGILVTLMVILALYELALKS